MCFPLALGASDNFDRVMMIRSRGKHTPTNDKMTRYLLDRGIFSHSSLPTRLYSSRALRLRLKNCVPRLSHLSSARGRGNDFSSYPLDELQWSDINSKRFTGNGSRDTRKKKKRGKVVANNAKVHCWGCSAEVAPSLFVRYERNSLFVFIKKAACHELGTGCFSA